MDIVVMGDAKAGRTTMIKTILQKMMFKSTKLLPETVKVQSYDIRIENLQFKVHDFPWKFKPQEAPPNQQMILKNAKAFIWMQCLQSQMNVLDRFLQMYQYLRRENKGGLSFFFFINKTDLQLTQEDTRNDYQLQIQKHMGDDNIDLRQIDFLFTSNTDISIFDAFSKVIQRLLPFTGALTRLLNHFAAASRLDKVYLFDVLTTIYLSHNDQTPIEPLRYELCSEMLDVFMDISTLYGEPQNQDQDRRGIVRLQVEGGDQIIGLKVFEKYLALVFTMKEDDYDKPYLLNENFKVFHKALVQLWTVNTSLQSNKK